MNAFMVAESRKASFAVNWNSRIQCELKETIRFFLPRPEEEELPPAKNGGGKRREEAVFGRSKGETFASSSISTSSQLLMCLETAPLLLLPLFAEINPGRKENENFPREQVTREGTLCSNFTQPTTTTRRPPLLYRGGSR